MTTQPHHHIRRGGGLVLLALIAGWACATVIWAARPAAAAGTGSIQGFTLDERGQAVGGVHVYIDVAGSFAGFAVSNSSGVYSIGNVPFGTYNITAKAACKGFDGTGVTVDGTERRDFTVPTASRSDSAGYACRATPTPYEHALGSLDLTGDDDFEVIALPFAFPFYGHTYTSAAISTNGALSFVGTNIPFTNAFVPGTGLPHAGVYPFWDDLVIDSSASVGLNTGFASNQLQIEWFNVLIRGTTDRISFTVRLLPDGRIEFNYGDIGSSPREHGLSATIGIENEAGTVGIGDSFNAVDVQSNVLLEFDTNAPPVAKAGPDLSVASGADFTLNGSASTDPDGQPLTVLWEQAGGPAVTILDRDKKVARVTGTPTGPTTLFFDVTVTDPFGQRSTDLVKVTVRAPK